MLGEISVPAQRVLITVAAPREDCSRKTRLRGFIRLGNTEDYYIKKTMDVLMAFVLVLERLISVFLSP